MNLWTKSPLVLAHRGDPENQNTLVGFRNAMSSGFDGVELDVRRTVDNVVVVIHDAVVNDIGVVSKLEFDHLRRLVPELPTLVEALDVLVGAVVNVEIKSSPMDPGFDPTQKLSALTAELLAERGFRDRVLISSFNPGAIDAFRAVVPDVPVGLLAVSAADPIDALAQVVEKGYDLVHPNVDSLVGEKLDQLVTAAHAASKRVFTWTVNDAVEFSRHSFGLVDVICRDMSEADHGTISDNA